MRVLVGFFGAVLIFILIATALRATLKQIMKDVEKAEMIAYTVTFVLTVAAAWFGYGPVATILVALYLGSGIVCDYFDKRNKSGASKD